MYYSNSNPYVQFKFPLMNSSVLNPDEHINSIFKIKWTLDAISPQKIFCMIIVDDNSDNIVWTLKVLLPVTEQDAEHYLNLYTEQHCQTSHLTQEHSDLQLLS